MYFHVHVHVWGDLSFVTWCVFLPEEAAFIKRRPWWATIFSCSRMRHFSDAPLVVTGTKCARKIHPTLSHEINQSSIVPFWRIEIISSSYWQESHPVWSFATVVHLLPSSMCTEFREALLHTVPVSCRQGHLATFKVKTFPTLRLSWGGFSAGEGCCV